jgi:hypothetical protein
MIPSGRPNDNASNGRAYAEHFGVADEIRRQSCGAPDDELVRHEVVD